MSHIVIGPSTFALDVIGLLPDKLKNNTLFQEMSNYLVTPGSSQVNMAFGLAKLGNKISLVGHYSEDIIGEICRRDIERAGIDISHMYKDIPNTYTAFVLAEPDVPRRTIFANDNLFIKNDTFSEYNLSTFPDMQCFGNLSTAIDDTIKSRFYTDLFKQAKKLAAITFLEPCEDHKKLSWEYLAPVLQWVDVFLPGYKELGPITGKNNFNEAVDFLLKYGIPVIAIKLSAKGCMICTADERIFSPTYDVPVLDLTGAGDGFAAGFIHCYLRGDSLQQAADFGNAYASSNIMELGPRAGMLSESEIINRMKGVSRCRCNDIPL
jgi:sugar/nucleoside kinase (ribokinase family)